MGDSMSTIINATTTNGVVIQPDNSGSLVLQTNSGTTALTISTAQNATFAAQATIPTINLTGGQIVFPATQSASADANTLDDYEEGTWTPVGNGVTLTGPLGIYTKVGNVVHVCGQWTYPTNSDANAATISGLPFTSSSNGSNYVGVVTATNYGSDNLYPFINAGTDQVLVRNNSNTNLTNANLSQKFVTFMATYRVA
jgi:hypothetical protein